MKPKPFVELNHFTVPVLIMNPFNDNILIHGTTRHAVFSSIFEEGSFRALWRNKTFNKLPNTDMPDIGLSACFVNASGSEIIQSIKPWSYTNAFQRFFISEYYYSFFIPAYEYGRNTTARMQRVLAPVCTYPD
jgi:hypothetical protein